MGVWRIYYIYCIIIIYLYFKRGIVFMLKEVKIELTNKCSRNCKHCSSNATSSIGNLKVLDLMQSEKYTSSFIH